jgi:hypothetical protein
MRVRFEHCERFTDDVATGRDSAVFRCEKLAQTLHTFEAFTGEIDRCILALLFCWRRLWPSFAHAKHSNTKFQNTSFEARNHVLECFIVSLVENRLRRKLYD